MPMTNSIDINGKTRTITSTSSYLDRRNVDDETVFIIRKEGSSPLHIIVSHSERLVSDKNIQPHLEEMISKFAPDRDIYSIPPEVVLFTALSVERIQHSDGGRISEAVRGNPDLVKELVAKFGEMVRVTLGVGEAKKQDEMMEPDSTEAALQRVEDLKRKYTPEQITEMRRLRAEVEAMVAKFDAVDKDKNLSSEDKSLARLALLQSFGIQKYRGKIIDGDPITFLGRTDTYGRFIQSETIFKFEIRRMDKELIVALMNTLMRDENAVDPLMTEDQYTELVAAGVFGGIREQELAYAKLNLREPARKRMHVINRKKASG